MLFLFGFSYKFFNKGLFVLFGRNAEKRFILSKKGRVVIEGTYSTSLNGRSSRFNEFLSVEHFLLIHVLLNAHTETVFERVRKVRLAYKEFFGKRF